MSAFLGPIHHVVYNKLVFQNNLNNLVINQYLPTLKANINEVCGVFSEGKLEDIIDLDNIHNWLSNQVQIIEKTQAMINDQLSSDDVLSAEQLYFKQGQILSSQSVINSPKDLFMAINKCFINGMPCDKGVVIEMQNDDEIIYTINPLVHPYGDFDKMLQLRNALIKGLNNNPKISYTNENNQFSIKESI